MVDKHQDLIEAAQQRHEFYKSKGGNDQFCWLQAIEILRRDVKGGRGIFLDADTGNVVGIPSQIPSNVRRVLEDIVKGIQPVQMFNNCGKNSWGSYVIVFPLFCVH